MKSLMLELHFSGGGSRKRRCIFVYLFYAIVLVHGYISHIIRADGSCNLLVRLESVATGDAF